MPRITFLPSGVTIDVQPGTTVYNAAARAEVAIPSQCGGKCACALCRVQIQEGAATASPMRWEEEEHLGNAFFLTQERLSCQLQVFGDATIVVPETSQKEKQRGRYIPHALIRKREKMEQEAELRRVRAESREESGRPAGRGPRRAHPGPGDARRGDARARSDGRSVGDAQPRPEPRPAGPGGDAPRKRRRRRSKGKPSPE